MSASAAIDGPTAVLTAVLTVTEAAWAACERGEASPEEIAAVLLERRALLARLDTAIAFTPSERELAGRVRDLDQRLLGWCDEQRRELAQALASQPRRSGDATAPTQRVLSDFA